MLEGISGSFQTNAVTQKGQAVLVIILVMVVTLTVGLSLASRSIVSTRTSTEEDNSQRAFSAAEAGIERLLKTDQGTVASDFGGARYSALVVANSPRGFALNDGSRTGQDEGADLWLSDYPTYSNKWSGNLRIYWGKDGSEGSCSDSPPSAAAVEIVVLKGNDINNPIVDHFVYDPCSGAGTRAEQNGFDSAGLGPYPPVDGTVYHYRTDSINIASGIVARIIPLYTGSNLAVTSSSDLPAQGKKIESTGNSGGAARRISVFQGYPRLPVELFPYAIFSPQ